MTAQRPTAPHIPAWHGASVLVVDDEPSLRRIVRRTLEVKSFHIEEAPDGEALEASRTVRSQTTDLVMAARELQRGGEGQG